MHARICKEGLIGKFIMSGVYRFSEKAYVTNICTTAAMYKS